MKLLHTAPRLSCAAVYQASGEKMRFLWGEDLRINVVHADDVAAAMWSDTNSKQQQIAEGRGRRNALPALLLVSSHAPLFCSVICAL